MAEENTADAADAAKTAADRMTDAARQTGDRMREGADNMREGAERAREVFQEKVAEPAMRAGEAIKASGETIAKGSSQIGTTMIDQAQSNAHEAFVAMRAAAGANDLAEVMKIQGDYLREQSQRSMSQAREIGEMIMQFGRDAVAPLRGGIDPTER